MYIYIYIYMPMLTVIIAVRAGEHNCTVLTYLLTMLRHTSNI